MQALAHKSLSSVRPPACVSQQPQSSKSLPRCIFKASTEQASSTSEPSLGSPPTVKKSQKIKPPVLVHFLDEKKEVWAVPGEVLSDVAERAGVDVSLGCNQGNCGVCEVELERFSFPSVSEGPPQGEGQEGSSESTQGQDGSQGGLGAGSHGMKGSGRQVVRACVARVPGGGYPRVEISAMTDQIWGVDGFDT